MKEFFLEWVTREDSREICLRRGGLAIASGRGGGKKERTAWVSARKREGLLPGRGGRINQPEGSHQQMHMSEFSVGDFGCDGATPPPLILSFPTWIYSDTA